MAAPFGIIQGQSKLGRDHIEIATRLATEFARMDAHRQAMIEQQDKSSGTLSVRSSASAGQLTLTGHGASVGLLVDVSWNGGSRTGMAVTEVNGNNVVVSGGGGFDLPAQDTALTCSHFTTVANVFKFHNGDGETISPNVAHAAFHETASFVGTSGPALLQLAARFRQ